MGLCHSRSDNLVTGDNHLLWCGSLEVAAFWTLTSRLCRYCCCDHCCDLCLWFCFCESQQGTSSLNGSSEHPVRPGGEVVSEFLAWNPASSKCREDQQVAEGGQEDPGGACCFSMAKKGHDSHFIPSPVALCSLRTIHFSLVLLSQPWSTWSGLAFGSCPSWLHPSGH